MRLVSRKNKYEHHLHKEDGGPSLFLITELSGVVYKVNTVGPRREPWQRNP